MLKVSGWRELVATGALKLDSATIALDGEVMIVAVVAAAEAVAQLKAAADRAVIPVTPTTKIYREREM